MMTIKLTGNPMMDGMINGFIFLPSLLADALSQFGVYNVGFWLGIIFFVAIILRLVFGFD